MTVYLRESQAGDGEYQGEGPGEEVEVTSFALYGVPGGPEGAEGEVPGVGEDDEPRHRRHVEVVHQEEDDGAGGCLTRPGTGQCNTLILC